MMRITQDFLNHLSPVELSFIRTGIDKPANICQAVF